MAKDKLNVNRDIFYSGLSVGAKYLYIIFCELEERNADEEGAGFYIEQSELDKVAEMKTDTVIKYVHELIDGGWLGVSKMVQQQEFFTVDVKSYRLLR